MILADMTWQEVEALDREVVVLIPTGSLEQHGLHLPLFTDSILVGSVAAGVEKAIPDQVLLTPTLWLGASGHHLAFPGSLSASFEGYDAALRAVVDSLIPHGFRKFYVLNGHGGNTEPNGIALRRLKAQYKNALFGHSGYFALMADRVAGVLEGPAKEMRHACEAEASLMMHLRPELVRADKLRDDGLRTEPPVKGAVLHFNEITEEGSLGYATFATAEKGAMLFRAAVECAAEEIRRFSNFVLIQIAEKSV